MDFDSAINIIKSPATSLGSIGQDFALQEGAQKLSSYSNCFHNWDNPNQGVSIGVQKSVQIRFSLSFVLKTLCGLTFTRDRELERLRESVLALF